MAEDVQIPKGLLAGLVTALVLSLLAVAFLMGRQTAPVVAVSTPEPVPTAAPLVASQPQETSLNARLDRIEQRVDRVGTREMRQAEVVEAPTRPEQVEPPRETKRQATRQASASAPAQESLRAAPSVDKQNKPEAKEKREYFRQIDSILKNTTSIDDPNQFATQFLQQAMNGDDSGFESLIATTRKTKAAIEGVSPPPSCQEHHRLLLKQVSESVVLLAEVHQAISTNDTSRLTSVAARGQEMQAETQSFQELDRRLRAP